MKSRSMLILMTVVLLAGCGGGEAADSPGGEDIEVDFPHIDGVDRIDAAELDDEHLPFAASDAVASLHLTEGRPMDVASSYTTGFPPNTGDGWSMVASRSDGYTMAMVLTNGQRVAVISMIPGEVIRQFPDKAEGHDLSSFKAGTGDVGPGEALIRTELATCQEETIDDCVMAVSETLYPPLQTR